MIQGKTQSAENGRVLIPGPQRLKDYNAGLGHLDRSLRASCEAFVRVVESLGKG